MFLMKFSRKKLMTAVGILFSLAALADSITERNGFLVKGANLSLKERFLIVDSERQLSSVINSASDSITWFIREIIDTPVSSRPDRMRYAFPEAVATLRLPPIASDGRGRFIVSAIYCWKIEKKIKLEFLIEWADITTNRRYTDSYVMQRSGEKWLFAGHGTVKPWNSFQSGLRGLRKCPG
jgi:hypothetical protein